VQWNVDVAEQILRQALPSGSAFLRALIDEGGTATVTRLLELIGQPRLNHMTLTLNTAARHVLGDRHTPDGARLRIAVPRPDPALPRSTRVHDHTLPTETPRHPRRSPPPHQPLTSTCRFPAHQESRAWSPTTCLGVSPAMMRR
jgi:hypothetical protein